MLFCSTVFPCLVRMDLIEGFKCQTISIKIGQLCLKSTEISNYKVILTLPDKKKSNRRRQNRAIGDILDSLSKRLE